ncbi:MAG: GDP-mannose 4,6-dehydratase [Chloroflexota bacterium]|nr:GDP-mannose 4,6-dehydratase [Chloroflexota bacterium]
MTTLITGGAGFIGSRLARRLLADGETVVILDNFDPYYPVAVKRENIADLGDHAVVIEGDIRDRALLDEIFSTYPIRRVAHMAAMSGVRYSAERGVLYADVNTTGSVALMDTARKHSVESFILSSTSQVYGETARVPFREDEPTDLPLAPYPASKRAAEIFAHTYYQLFGLNVTVLRFFNVYGPGGRPDMMPLRVIDSLVHDTPITVFDGDLKRDWTYIDDVLDGVISALNTPLGYAIFNLGCGAPITLDDFIGICERLIGKTAIRVPTPTPPTEPTVTYCDNTRARERLGFAPRVDIAEGLARTWAWYQARFLTPPIQTP